MVCERDPENKSHRRFHRGGRPRNWVSMPSLLCLCTSSAIHKYNFNCSALSVRSEPQEELQGAVDKLEKETVDIEESLKTMNDLRTVVNTIIPIIIPC